MSHTERYIRLHALAACPREACGLVVRSANLSWVLPGRNVSPTPETHFVLEPEAYAQAEELGEVVAVWHSHPNGPDGPSPADRAACEASGLPWIVYSLPSDSFTELRPTDSSRSPAPLLGREYVFGVHDCGTLVADYYGQVLGIACSSEPYPSESFWLLPGHVPYRQKLVENGFTEVLPATRHSALSLHDVLLMQVAGADEANHAAVYVGGNLILHHLRGRLSCRDVYGEFWRRATRHVMRHPRAAESNERRAAGSEEQGAALPSPLSALCSLPSAPHAPLPVALLSPEAP